MGGRGEGGLGGGSVAEKKTVTLAWDVWQVLPFQRRLVRIIKLDKTPADSKCRQVTPNCPTLACNYTEVLLSGAPETP
eukprot:2167205-Amphidinium_carterae.1